MKPKSLCEKTTLDGPMQHRHEHRRYSVPSILSFFLGLVFLVYIGYWWPRYVQERPTLQHDVDAVLNGAPLIDGHNDFPIWIRAFYHNHIYTKNFTDAIELFGQVDFPRLREGRLRGQFWSVYVECPDDSTSYDDEVYLERVRDTFQQIDLVHRLIRRFSEHLAPAYSDREVWSNFRSNSKISSLLGVEGLHQIGNSASVLRMYHDLGVRYVTLTHTCHNRYADSEEPAEALHGGLSDAGVRMVSEMNRIGLIADISHTSFETQRSVLRESKAPVMFSHSSAFTVCNHTRNVPDDILMSLKANGGIVMITFYPEFTHCADPASASLLHVADHMEYVGNLIGYRHVGIGSDFDGMQNGPEGLEDVSKYPALVEELLRRGVSIQDLKGVVGGNVLRVLGDVEHVAEELGQMNPLEDDVKAFF